MGRLTVLALRIVLAGVLAGSLFVQAVMVPLLYMDLDGPDGVKVRLPIVVLTFLGIVTLQVTVVCVWRLVTMVARGTVFSDAAFRYVDVMFGAVAAGSLVVFGLRRHPRAGRGRRPRHRPADLRGVGDRRRDRADRPRAADAAGPGGRPRGGGAPPPGRARRGHLMPIIVDVDVMLARRKMSVGALADQIGITPANLAVLKNGRAKAVRFTTLAALCEALGCQPGDLLRWEPEEPADRQVA